MNTSASSRKKIWLRWIKRFIAVVVLVALIGAVHDAVVRWQSETASKPIRINPREVVFAALCYAMGLLPPALILRSALNTFGLPCSLSRAAAAQLIGHAGKYIPGKAMVVVLRVSSVTSAKDQIGRATTCVFFETLLMMSVGGAVAGVLTWSTPLPMWVKWGATGMAVVAAIPTLPPVMRLAIETVRRRRAGADSQSQSTVQLSWHQLGWGWFWSLFSWGLIGASFAFLMRAIPAQSELPPFWQTLPVATAAIALGMVLGFASLLPGGAGVREWVTLTVLATWTDPTHALLCVIAARLLFILVEAVMAGISYGFLKRADVNLESFP